LLIPLSGLLVALVQQGLYRLLEMQIFQLLPLVLLLQEPQQPALALLQFQFLTESAMDRK
jgi:hypothetical protein